MYRGRQIQLIIVLLLACTFAGAQNIDVSANYTRGLFSAADTGRKVCIRSISIEGNRRTKDFIIRREMHLKSGDSVTIGQLNKELQQLQLQVYNTNLFLEVKPGLTKAAPDAVDISVQLKERWYIFPIPKFQLIDRNINEWLQKYNGDLNRVVYGVKFTHYNLTGHRDLLRLTLLNGFTRNVSLTYFKPVSNKSLNNGFSFTAGVLQNREFIYRIDSSNKPLLFNNGTFSRRQITAGIGYNYRKNILGTHYFNVNFIQVGVTDSLIDPKYNANYFRDPVTSRSFFDFVYTYQYVNANNAIYPLKGTLATLRVTKRGLGFSGGVNMLAVEGHFNRYWALPRDWFLSWQLSAKTTLPFTQPYINQRALGYADVNLRGLELYVVDGVAFGMSRQTLRKKLFTLHIRTPLRSDKYRVVPFTVFAKTYGDLGLVYNRAAFSAQLNNRLLYTGGFGIDILSIYDVNLRVEYSFNQLGKNGLFLQAQSGL
jgi:outer membrane protein assembly factor BamA